MLNHLKSHLQGKVVILGIGNTLRSDDGVGSILASRIKGKVPFIVFDAGESPENYLEKVIKEKPDNIVIIDAVDFGGKPGEFRVLEAQDLKTTNLFSTHNASISLTINYLQSNLKVDIIILIIQPKSISFGDKLSQEVAGTLNTLESWFGGTGKEEG
ncbi:MAG: hydrogenase 3 maturation endopeptidase HyCI [Candidatus Omnitrophota bacterium]